MKIATVEVHCSGNKANRESCKLRFPDKKCMACGNFHFSRVLKVESTSCGEGGVKRQD